MTSRYQRYIDEILELIPQKYTNEDGVLIEHKGGGRTRHILDDLGDYLPFFAYLKQDEFCENQIKALPKYMKGNLLKPLQKIFGIGVNTPYEHSDLVLGLVDYYNYKKDPKTLELAEKVTHGLLKKFKLHKMKSSFYFPSIHVRLPLFDSMDGMYIELLVWMYKVTNDEKYLKHAEGLAKRMLKLPLFKKEHLFPSLTSPVPWVFPKNIRQRTREVKLMKNNTNTIFGLIELYKTKPEAYLKVGIDQWIRAVETKLMNDEGGVHGTAIKTKDGWDLKPVELTPNFAVLDCLCDAYHVFKDESYLKLAVRMGDYWLSKQSKETGLLPLFPDEAPDSYLDSETDMLVAFHKLAELTGDKRYKESADGIMDGILKHHHAEGGYYLKVDINTGKPTQEHFKTKFITLFLKALILYETEGKLYNDPDLFELLKDR
jgi:hypothetical protein